MSHQDHGWPKTSFDEENNNRYQPGAPLVVYCGRCKKALFADDAWAVAAADGDARVEGILLQKIHKWDGKHIVIGHIGQDGRGRLEATFVERAAPVLKKPGWLARLFAQKEK